MEINKTLASKLEREKTLMIKVVQVLIVMMIVTQRMKLKVDNIRLFNRDKQLLLLHKTTLLVLTKDGDEIYMHIY